MNLYLTELRDKGADRHSEILNVHPGEPYEREANAKFRAYQAGFDKAHDTLMPILELILCNACEVLNNIEKVLK